MNLRRATVLFVPIVWLACTELATPTPAPIDGGAVSDAGGTGTPDATSPAPVDAAFDALPDVAIDANPQAATVLVRGADGAPKAGVTVVFGDATGAVVATETTNAQGAVSRALTAGTQVTAILGTELYPEIVTVLGAQNGDVLTAVEEKETSESRTVSITSVPGGAPDAATSLRAEIGPCRRAFIVPPTTFTVDGRCMRAGKFPLLLKAMRTDELAYTHLKNNVVPPPDGGPINVAPTAAWLTDTTSQTVSASNAPPGGSLVLGLAEVTDGVPFLQAQNIGTPPDGGVGFVTFPSHPGYASFVQREATSYRYLGQSGIALRSIAARTATPTASSVVNHDLAQLLPEITAATLDTATPARPSTTFTTAGTTAGADVIVYRVRWEHARDGGTQRGRWTIVGPPTTTTFTCPALPAASASWGPQAGATFTTPPFVGFFDATFLSGYDAARGQAAAFSPSEDATNGFAEDGMVPPLPVDGTVRLSAITYSAD